MFKGFRTFWPFSLVFQLVKVVDNFWKFCGIIDGFNESSRQIAFRVGKTADEWMSAIQFRTTPKGYLPHYYYIFGIPEQLGTDMSNLECSRLGTMLYLDIQKGKEYMKTSEF